MAKGISTRGDALVNQTADGVGLNEVWQEIADALALYNEERTTIASLLSYRTVQVADAVPQSISSESFEEATEFGVPRAIRPPVDVPTLGYQFKDFDVSLRAAWKFLREATAEQVTAQVVRVLEADNKLVNGTVLRRLFTTTVFQNEFGHNCYGLWNADGMTPPPYLGKTFSGTHTHTLMSQSTVTDSQDIEDMLRLVTEHDYGRVGSQMLILAHPDDVDATTMTAWRAGISYRAGGPLPKYDFIPNAAMPAWISHETIHGPVPASEYNGLTVYGSYGGAILLQSMYIPKGYVAAVASGGPNSEINPVGLREHINPSYQGLRHIGGNGPYPIQDSFLYGASALACDTEAQRRFARSPRHPLTPRRRSSHNDDRPRALARGSRTTARISQARRPQSACPRQDRRPNQRVRLRAGARAAAPQWPATVRGRRVPTKSTRRRTRRRFGDTAPTAATARRGPRIPRRTHRPVNRQPGRGLRAPAPVGLASRDGACSCAARSNDPAPTPSYRDAEPPR